MSHEPNLFLNSMFLSHILMKVRKKCSEGSVLVQKLKRQIEPVKNLHF